MLHLGRGQGVDHVMPHSLDVAWGGSDDRSPSGGREPRVRRPAVFGAREPLHEVPALESAHYVGEPGQRRVRTTGQGGHLQRPLRRLGEHRKDEVLEVAQAGVPSQLDLEDPGQQLHDRHQPQPSCPFLVVPADASAAAEVAAALPQSRVLKAFNTTFAATLASGRVGGLPTTVLIAGNDADAKSTLAGIVTSGDVKAVDAGSLDRARELEALGFLQLTLAVGEKISWSGGFAVVG